MPPTWNSAGGRAASDGHYLFSHPDVNDFYNVLEGLTRDQSTLKVQAYMKTHPKTKADLDRHSAAVGGHQDPLR